LAVLMNQRMVSNHRSGSVTFWAWIASITFHLIVLTAFGFVKFAQSKTQAERPTPTAKINQIKRFMETAPAMPKPKVKRSDKSRFTKKMDRLLPINRICYAAKPSPQDGTDTAKPSISKSVFLSSSSTISPHRTEFFGSFTDQRRVCYLVDCSGSMQGIFGQVRKKLKDSIARLQPDQYFYIIFFGGNRLFEFGDGYLVRAAEQTKSSAYDFIDSVRPAGQTNALAALERAVQIRDGRGQSPSIIYFLTDGFELTAENERQFPRKIANFFKKFAPTTRINTIGFWPESDDHKMLQTIAKQSGGESVFITGR
jgi:hypothetical protein